MDMQSIQTLLGTVREPELFGATIMTPEPAPSALHLIRQLAP